MASVIAAMSHQPATCQDVRISRADSREAAGLVRRPEMLLCWNVGGRGSRGAAAASSRLDDEAVHSVTIPCPGAQLPLMEPMATMWAAPGGGIDGQRGH